MSDSDIDGTVRYIPKEDGDGDDYFMRLTVNDEGRYWTVYIPEGHARIPDGPLIDFGYAL